MIGERTVDGFTAVTLTAPEQGIEASFVPGAGMVGCSLLHRGEELLGQRGGLGRYVEKRSTMGIPLLHPWANRLGARRFDVAGREVDVDAAEPPPSTDPNGLPIHGLLAAAPGWRVSRREATADGGTVAAEFDFTAEPGLIRAFPFPHEVELEVALAGPELTISTAVRASGDAAVPVSFGFHPYFTLPGVGRPGWKIEIPVRERLLLDERMLPTGGREPVTVQGGALGSRTFDDAYVAPPGAQPFVVAGGGRRIEVTLESGFPYAQVYAPDDDDVIALEPMTAPSNALVTGADLPSVEPGESFTAVFSVTVTESPD
jgi:galactose mutarotase-like enzyme